MEAVEGSLFEASEMTAKLLASTNILVESWKTCSSAKSHNSEGFVINQNGCIGVMGFAGLKDLTHGYGLGSNLKDMVPLQDGDLNGLFSGLGRHGEDDEEPVMVHAGILKLFLGVHASSSFQSQDMDVVVCGGENLQIVSASVERECEKKNSLVDRDIKLEDD